MHIRNSAGTAIMSLAQSGVVGINNTAPDARLRITGSGLAAVPYEVEPNNKIYASVYAEHAAFPPGSNPDMYVAVEGVAKIRSLTTDTRYRAGIHGVLVTASGFGWTASGGLGFERTGTGQNWIAGVAGTISNNDPGIGSGLTAIAGRFVNTNSTSGVENYAIWASGPKSYFSSSVGIGTTNPLSVLHTNGSRNMTIPSWNLNADVNIYSEQLDWADDQTGVLIVGQFSTSSSGSTVLSSGARIAVQGSLINKNQAPPDNQVSQASIAYQHHSNKEIAGIAADVYNVATPTGYNTFAGHFHNRKSGSTNYGIYVVSGGIGI